MKAQFEFRGARPRRPTAVGTQDVAAQPCTASARPGMLCITIVSIDWCPWIDAQGSVWDDIRKDICSADGGGESPHPPHPMTDRGAEDFDLLLFPSLTLLAQGPQVSRASECKKTHKEATNRTNSFLKSPHTKPCASIQGHQSIGTMMMHNMPSRACWKRPHPASPPPSVRRNPKPEIRNSFFFLLRACPKLGFSKNRIPIEKACCRSRASKF